MKEKMREDLCRNFTLHIFLSVANVSKIQKQNVNLFVLSVIAHMFTMKFITYADTQLPVVRDIWWLTQLPGVTRNRCSAETLLYIVCYLI